MNNIKQNDDAGLADFLDGWRTAFAHEQGELTVSVTYAVIGLTYFRGVPRSEHAIGRALGPVGE